MVLIVPDTLQIGIEMTHSGQTVMNVIGIRVSLLSGTNSPQQNLGHIKTAWEAANGPMERHLSGTTMVGYHYTDLRFEDGATDFLGSNKAGTSIWGISTMASCAVIKLSGGTRNRSEHGRIFHGPLSEESINNDGRTISGSYLTDLKNAYQQFADEIQTHDLGLAVISRKLSTSKDVNSISVPAKIATQRRRIG